MMDRKRIEHQLAKDLEEIMLPFVGQPQTFQTLDAVRTACKREVEAYLVRMFHPSGDLPVEFVSTTTAADVERGYMGFEFRDRKTGKLIETAAELMRLLGMP